MITTPTAAAPTAAALLAEGQRTTPTCSYCQQPHSSYACTKVVSVDDRKVILRSAGRCFLCLCRGHILRQCTSKFECPNCGGRHHRSICYGQQPPSNESESTPNQESGQPVKTMTNLSTGMNPAAQHFQPCTATATTNASKPSTSTSLWTSGNQAILLQTAIAIAYNPTAPEKSRRVRIVFDSGSQRSYMREQVAKDLSLTSEDEKSLTIITFGSKREQTRVCNLVRLGLTTKDEISKQLMLFTVPTIC